MNRSLYLIKNVHVRDAIISFEEKLSDHNAIIEGYFDTFKTRNYSETTIRSTTEYVRGWFEGVVVQDSDHPNGERQLFVWEAMDPIQGRQRIINFSKGLCALELKVKTKIQYLGMLRRLFAYVLEWPYVPVNLEPIFRKYGPIKQPVLEYDYPAHSLDPEEEGFPPTGDDLLDFYNFIRTDYLSTTQKKLSAERNYAMVVVVGESGLRAREICGLDALGQHRDLFYEKGMIQTRYGKGTNGSGSRVRKTIFTELAQATMHPYEEKVRTRFLNAQNDPALFLSDFGCRISYKSMEYNLRRIVEEARKAGLNLPPRMSWHILRKAFATNFIERYPDRIWQLMGYLGHINPGTLHRYVKHSRAYAERVVTQVQGLLMPRHTLIKRR